MNFSPKVQPVQEEKKLSIQKCKNFVFQVLSGTNQFPPGLDEFQPKSPASPGGNKLSNNPKCKIFFVMLKNMAIVFTPEIGELQPNNPTISGAKYIYKVLI